MSVLISHAGADKQAAQRIIRRLKKEKIEAREDNIWSACGATDDAPSALIVRQLQRYTHVIALISPSYLSARWLRREMQAAQFREMQMNAPFLIPALVSDCELPPELLHAVDLRGEETHPAILDVLLTHLRESNILFVIMKFGDDSLDSTYKTVIKDVAARFGFVPIRVDEINDSGEISSQIINAIDRSYIVLADLTGERPNCYFETGYALGTGKELILTARTDQKIHFDLAGRRIIFWSTPYDLQRQLEVRLMALRDAGSTA